MRRVRATTFAVVLAVTGTLVAGCGDDDADRAAAPAATTTGDADGFCAVQPRFAEQLNMALANADPDAAQYTAIGGILEDLAPVIEELRDAEPPELEGVVTTWETEMGKFATGDFPVEPAERARQRMDAWVASNC